MNDTPKMIDTAISLGALSTLAATSRAILSSDRRSLTGFMRGLILAAFVGTLVGLGTADYFTPTFQGFLVGIAAFIADDLLMMVLNVSTKLRKDPMLIFDYILRRR